MLRVCEVVLEIWVGHIIAQDMFRADADGPMLTFLKQRLLDALVLFIPLQLLVHCGTIIVAVCRAVTVHIWQIILIILGITCRALALVLVAPEAGTVTWALPTLDAATTGARVASSLTRSLSSQS